jgi:nucleotide-binding universal stress UspA family protein
MKILLAYDGSEDARRALEHVAGLAGGGDSTVRVITVVPSHAEAGPHAASVHAFELAERHRQAREARDLLAARGIAAETVEPTGDPGLAIVGEARRQGADVIVTGTRGHSTVARLVLGSVSTSVLHHAPCDVLVVCGEGRRAVAAA